jgi:hypothetical protein
MNTSAAVRESVIDRVKKLLALAGNNENVNEAAAAMARAQRLMLDHKLAAAEIESDDEAAPAIGELIVDEPGGFVMTWKAALLVTLSKANFCELVESRVITPSGKRAVRFRIIGTETDTNVVAYCYRYLCAEIDRLCDAEATGRGFQFRNAFRRGAVAAIAMRLAEERKRAVQEAPDAGRALVVLRKADEAVADFINRKFTDLKNKKLAAVTDMHGYTSGVEAGKKIAIPGRQQQGALGAEPRKLRG